MDVKDPRIEKAIEWLSGDDGAGFLASNEHCSSRDIFDARLEHMSREMEGAPQLKEIHPLLVAVAGEIGNNSFDHNLGSWRDEPGIYFAYDLLKRFIISADRGQGVLATLKRVRPELGSEKEAIKVAFKEIISGRSPEQRGNGLKFVESVAQSNGFTIYFYSGDGMYIVNNGLREGDDDRKLHGVLAIVFF